MLSRYCKKAKAVFKELKQKPYVVELDERGILPLPLVSTPNFLYQSPRVVRQNYSGQPSKVFSTVCYVNLSS